MTLRTVDVEEQQLGVTWDYDMNRKRDITAAVTVQVLYRISGEEDYIEDPSKIPADQKHHYVQGQFSPKDKYVAKLRVYEGDIQLPSMETNEVQYIPAVECETGSNILVLGSQYQAPATYAKS